MRRGLALTFLTALTVTGLLLSLGLLVVSAAPAQQGAIGVITSPKPGTAVRGSVSIEGTATHADFWKYEVHYGRGASPSGWVLIGDVHTTSVTNGRLEVWNTGLVPDGVYTLRVRVVRKDGNYEDFFARDIRVANTTPTDTPTPSETATPLAPATATPLPASPTVLIDQPKRETPSPSPSATRPAAMATATSVPLPDVSGTTVAGWLWSGAKIVLYGFAVLAVLVIARVILGWIARGIYLFLRSKLKKDEDLDD
jgi:hypothetical protein